MLKEKTTKTNEKMANLNQVEGFNPEEYARVISGDGESARKYLDVVWRKLWFYMKYPNGRITKKIVQITNNFIIVEARVYFDRNDAEENYVSSAMAQRWFKKDDVFGERAVETAETGAVGRALADAGFGLQYCCDINDGSDHDIVDAPIDISSKKPENAAVKKADGTKSDTVGKTENTSTDKKDTVTESVNVQTKLTSPVGLLGNLTNKTANAAVSGNMYDKTDALKKNEPKEETSAASTENKANGAENPDNNEIPEAPENDRDIQTGTGTETPAQPQDKKYDNSMEAGEIEKIMTVEEACEFVIDVGFNKGKTLGELGLTKPEKLEWYFKSYTGPNNILRAGAKIIADYVAELEQKQTAA